MSEVMRALLSVSDKTGLPELGAGLAGLEIELLATGGSADALQQAGLKVTRTESLTGFAELLDGRVKTLHPAIHAGILAKREDPRHMEQLRGGGFGAIDLVVVNLYPFQATVAKPGVTLAEAVEQIDIGGVALLRSAAKNHASVAVVVDPADYPVVLAELTADGRRLTEATRQRLALKAFQATATYDAAIASWLATRFAPDDAFPERLTLAYRKRQPLRYGENPHQAAALYREDPVPPGSLAGAELLNGKELSHNNYLDFDSALGLAHEFAEPACAVIKHRNACGCAAAASLGDAIVKAVRADALSAFGGMVAVNRVVDGDAARAVLEALKEAKKFDGFVAPDFTPEALEILKNKPAPFPGKNLCLLRTGAGPAGLPAPVRIMRTINGGLLAQDPDVRPLTREELKVVTKRTPTEEELTELLFAWSVCKHLVSNAIVMSHDHVTVGIGAGQVNRVGSVIIAARQAGERARGAVLASDAFFPYPDGVEEAGKAGVTAIIQPGGSVKDPDTTAAADRYGMAMVMTGVRHFKH